MAEIIDLYKIIKMKRIITILLFLICTMLLSAHADLIPAAVILIMPKEQQIIIRILDQGQCR